jgi:hypothetical protein
MVATGAATAIALIALAASCAIGVIVGVLMCRVCRLSWSWKVAACDVGLVVVVSIASAFAYSAIAIARGRMDSGVKWIWLTAAASVVARHLVRLGLRSR